MTLLCTCGHAEDNHIDNEAQCFIVGCGCKEFELKDADEDFSKSEPDEPEYNDTGASDFQGGNSEPRY